MAELIRQFYGTTTMRAPSARHQTSGSAHQPGEIRLEQHRVDTGCPVPTQVRAAC